MEIKNLVSISQQIGTNYQYVQGGGGNTSVKINNYTMAIKASGSLLKNMSLTHGYCLIQYPKIKELLTSTVDEKSFNSKVQKLVYPNSPSNNPSIETSFHAIGEKYVIHSHSIYANILNCTKEGQNIIKNLFPEAMSLPYHDVGFNLALALINKLKQYKTTPNIIFLQNHGLIVTTNSAADTLKLHEYVNTKIKNYFNIKNEMYNTQHKYDITQDLLFPDQAVYCCSNMAKITESKAAKETQYAYDIILSIIDKNFLTPIFLLKTAKEKLLSMESEKHRQQVILNDNNQT